MRYIFGECTLDTQRAELARAGRVKRLRRKVFQTLVYLLVHADRVVSKHELCEQVWPQQFISDAALETVIKAVRQAIGDSGRNQRLVQTVYGQGYRFVAVVTTADQTPPDRPAMLALAGASTDVSLALETLTTTGARECGALAATEEWKFVTVLCCALAAPPPEAPREAEPHYHALHALVVLAEAAVQRYGGTLQPVVGDHIIALFGAPRAQEDHARCAVLAALDLQQHLCQHPPLRFPAPGGALAVRMGVHSGLVVVGEFGPAAHGQVTAVGAPTQVALRLQQQAAPGALLVSAATYDLVREEVRGEPCGSLVLDGWQTPLPVYAVQGLVQRHAGVPQRARHSRSPFVGRQRELALLHDRLEVVRAGEGQVVSLVGPPGIGKTRLLTEFGRGLASDQVAWYSGQCLAYGQAMPYLPVRDIVQQVCTLGVGDPLETRTAAVRRWLTALGGVAEALLLQCLDLPMASERLTRLTPEARQARTFALLGHLIRHAAQRQPLVLAVENVHWIDPTSAAWLGFLVERLAGMAVLLLVTQRPEYQPPWAAHAVVTQLALPPLRVEESQAIVAAVPGTAQLPTAQCQQIIAHGVGNPFFLEELAWYAVEHGPAATPVSVPATVHAVLTARLDRLPTAAKALLQTAAVIGPEIPVPLLQAITELPEEVLQRHLAHLQAAELLYETRLVSEPAFTFKHVLTQEVAYGSLLQEPRRVLHTRIVAALETLYAARLSEQVEHLAYHAFRGEVWDKALAYLWQAGAKAEARSAYQEVLACYEQALHALQQLPDCRATREQAIDLRLDLRHALAQLDDWGRTLELLREATTLAEMLGDHRRQALIESALANYFRRTGDYDSALVAGQRAYTLAAALGEVSLQAVARAFLGPIYYDLGNFHQAREILEENVVHLTGKQRYERFGLPCVAAVWSRVYLVMSLAQVGAFAEGHALGTEAVQIAEAVNHPYSLMVAYYGSGFLSLRQGYLPEATAMLEHGLAVCRAGHVRSWLPLLTGGVGYAYALTGRLAEGLPLLEQALQQDTARGWGRARAMLCGYLGMAYLWAGRLTEARSLLQQALDIARQQNSPVGEAAALYHLGALARLGKSPQLELAEAHYRQALARAEKLDMRPLIAHCHLDLGTLYLQMARQEQACTALSAAIALYRAMDMTFWLPRAEAALAQVEGRCP
jgi:DNA-binding winged helix-turn-helix (wHTH) protein/class 3 adenylate cyclase/tetratricopeptide (TPR) repeat protein